MAKKRRKPARTKQASTKERPASGQPRRRISIYIKIIGALLPLVVLLILVEVGLRLAGADPQYKNQFFPINRDIDFMDVYKRDAELFWRFRPDNTVSSERYSRIDYYINEFGRRGHEPSPSNADLRLVALGNSCTFGWAVRSEYIWTTQLEDLLERSSDFDDVEVINAGVPGYTSYQGKKYFKRELISLDPDYVLIMFGWNDHWVAGKDISDADHEVPSGFILKLHNMISPLRTFQFARKIVLSITETEEQVRLDNVAGTRRVSQGEFVGNLKDIIRTARDNQIRPILLIPPIASLEGYFSGSRSDLHELHARYQRVIERVGTETEVPVVDLQSAFDEYTDLFDAPKADPIHFNAKGHAVVAREITKILRSSLHSE